MHIRESIPEALQCVKNGTRWITSRINLTKSSVVGVKRWVGHVTLHIPRNSPGRIQHVINVYVFNWWNRNNCCLIAKVMKILFVFRIRSNEVQPTNINYVIAGYMNSSWSCQAMR